MASGRKALETEDAARILASFRGKEGSGQEVVAAVFPPGHEWKAADVRGVRFCDVEWPGVVIKGGLLGRGRIQQCRFETVNFDSLRCRRVDFSDCHFESVVFGEHYFGSITDCGFLHCSFVKCRFDGVGVQESRIRFCRFEEMVAERASWKGCALEDVVFTGALAKTNFVSSTLRRVDLSEAVLRDSSSCGDERRDVQLPDWPDNFAIDPR